MVRTGIWWIGAAALVLFGCAADADSANEEGAGTAAPPPAVASAEQATSAVPTTTEVPEIATSTVPPTTAPTTTTTVVAPETTGNIDIGDPSTQTGLWSLDETDQQVALENLAETIPIDPTLVSTRILEVQYENPGEQFVENARLMIEALLEQDYEILHSRCWIDQNEEIVEFVLDSGNNHLVWVDWQPDDTVTGDISVFPTDLDGVDFDNPHRRTQESLIEFLASGRYPFEDGVDPNCAPILSN